VSAQEKETIPQDSTVSARDTDAQKARKTKIAAAPFVFTFCVTMATWCVLSGRFDAFHLILGVTSCLIVSYFSADMVLASKNVRRLPMVWLRFLRYIPWLLFQVFIANVHVMYLALHPRMMERIDPQIVRFKSRLTSDLALVTLANSITLTPGTITVYISVYGDVTFHMIDAESGQSLPWIMDARIAEVFGQ
jgi:multicomponent Na+:H+ antiporter subunit E